MAKPTAIAVVTVIDVGRDPHLERVSGEPTRAGILGKDRAEAQFLRWAYLGPEKFLRHRSLCAEAMLHKLARDGSPRGSKGNVVRAATL